MRRLLLFLIGLLAAGAALFQAASYHPLAFLPGPERGLAARQTPLAATAGRKMLHVTLGSPKLGDIGFTVNLPDPLPAGKLPVVFVMGGLASGEENIRLIENPGPNVLVGYDWPIPVFFPEGRDVPRQLPSLYWRALTIAGQAGSALRWLAQQPWADPARLSLLGYSLGGLAAPAVQHAAQQDGIPVGWTILAYGGAPLHALFAGDPYIEPAWARTLLAPCVGFLLRPLEPTVHLPRLSGRFLVLEGQDDRLIPEAARKRLADAVPQPKTVVTLAGQHMGAGPDEAALLDTIIAASRDWLIANDAVNAPP